MIECRSKDPDLCLRMRGVSLRDAYPVYSSLDELLLARQQGHTLAAIRDSQAAVAVAVAR